MRIVLTGLLVILAAGAADKKAIYPADGPKPAGPYNPGILVGDFLYVAGQAARNRDGSYPDSPEGQVRQCMNNVKTIVEAAGLTMEHVVYSQVYLHPSVTYETLGKVWTEFYPKNPPARATLGIHAMPSATPVQINAVAVKDLSMKKAVNPPGWVSTSIAAGMIAGDRFYVSGLIGRDPKTGQIPEDPAAQVQLSLDRVGEVLKTAGLDFRHMVFVNPYLSPKMPMGVMNKIYAKHFEFGNTPARATIGVSWLPHGANIEFTGVAVRDLSKRQAVRPKNMAPSPTASPCVWAGDTYYCSAKSGFIPGVGGGIFADRTEDQVRQTMRNLLDGLEEAGLDFSHVVATNVYLDNVEEFAKMNATYGRYFPQVPPTRSTVGPLPPVERKRNNNDSFPKLEEISLIAVR